MKAIVFSTTRKNFAVVSAELAKAMLFTGNPHGFNRATEFSPTAESHMISVFESNGYTNESHSSATP